MAKQIRAGHLLLELAHSHPGHDAHDHAHESHSLGTESL
jgi:hypothetical protein